MDLRRARRPRVGAGEPRHGLAERLAYELLLLELVARRGADRGARHAAIVRLEQLYPLALDEVLEAIGRYGPGAELVWAQEEPSNMGAWDYVEARLVPRLPGPVQLVARAPSASPAVGSATRHKLEQEALVRDALGEPAAKVARAGSRATPEVR